MDNAQLINQASGKTNWFTPPHIIEAARAAMTSIDLDPASCAAANAVVGAKEFYEADGVCRPWYGNVWLNWPYGRKENQEWTRKAIAEYKAGYIEQACLLGFAATSESWFQPLLSYPVCLIKGRLQFIDGDTMQPVKGGPKGSAVIYLGSHVNRFARAFQSFGKVMVPYV